MWRLALSKINIMDYLGQWVDMDSHDHGDCAGWDERREVIFEGAMVCACIYLDIVDEKYHYMVWTKGNKNIFSTGSTESYDLTKFIATVDYMRSRDLILKMTQGGSECQ